MEKAFLLCYFAGMSRVWLYQGILIAAAASLVGSLVLAATLAPFSYDWRYRVMSSLASPRDNPHGYLFACAGIVLAGVLLIPCIHEVQGRMVKLALPWIAPAGTLLGCGDGLFILSGLVVPQSYLPVLGITRSHEWLARGAGVCFCLTFLLYAPALTQTYRKRSTLVNATLVWLACPLAFLTVFGFVTSRILLVVDHAAWRHSLVCSLALWEWAGAVSIYLFMFLLFTFLPSARKP